MTQKPRKVDSEAIASRLGFLCRPFENRPSVCRARFRYIFMLPSAIAITASFSTPTA
jgi:hypothetical protein